MDAMENRIEVIRAKLNLETAQIAWKELQRFFASGAALKVASDLDLVEAALQISEDNAAQIREWMLAGKLGKVTDEQAAVWRTPWFGRWWSAHTCWCKPQAACKRARDDIEFAAEENRQLTGVFP